MASLPPGWVKKHSNTHNKPYYFNLDTGESTWEPPVHMPVEQVRVAHLLVKHRESRRPASWKEENITRSKEDALAMIKEYREKIVRGEASMTSLATTESDCSSAKRGGDLGSFARGQMQKPFEDASFGMDIGALNNTSDGILSKCWSMFNPESLVL